MKKRLATVGLSMALAWSGIAQAQVDLRVLDRGMAGTRAQVLVLGSVHLSELPDSLQPASFEPLLARLAAFEPDVIAIEAIPGESCDLMARYPSVYDKDSVSAYCSSTEAARTATGLGVPAAIAEVDKALAAWPSAPTPAQRRRLAALFMAAGDQASALTQWLQLPPAERRAGDGLDAALAMRLDKTMAREDERYRIAAPLAARLGLARVFAIDDHTGDNVAIADAEVGAYGDAIRQAWRSSEAQLQPLRKREGELVERGDMLALYRYINRPDVRQVQADGDFGAAMRDGSPTRLAQVYVAGWETRNLRMVANIRATFRERPGARVLVVVGASHKPWFDSLLGQMQGVDVVDVETVLQPGPE